MNTREMSLNDSSLYDSDFLIWINTQVELLQKGQFDQLDLGHLVEEIADMGKSVRRELRHRLELLLQHLLKCQFQPGRRSGSWIRTLAEQRHGISDLLRDAPSLRHVLGDDIAEAYPRAIRLAAAETRLPGKTFPITCPWTTEQILDIGFIPGRAGAP